MNSICRSLIFSDLSPRFDGRDIPKVAAPWVRCFAAAACLAAVVGVGGSCLLRYSGTNLRLRLFLLICSWLLDLLGSRIFVSWWCI